MNLSWDILNSLAANYGDSFYLLNLARFEANYQAFLSAFRTAYAKTELAYSYKTNYTPQLCHLVQQWGGYAEVVSAMEYELARALNVPANRIIFNGPYKPRQIFEHALLEGAIVNLDSTYELVWLQDLVKRFPDKLFEIGIRCNFALNGEQRSRFGFDVTQTNFPETIQSLQRLTNCNIIGLHCHYLPSQRSPERYAAIAQHMLQLATRYIPPQTLRFIDLGGGFFSRMPTSLQQQFSHPIPDFTAYGQAIGEVFSAAFPEKHGPTLILEPGLALVADVMQFITQVIDIKRIDQRTLALVSGSQYDSKPTLNPKNLPITVLSAPKSANFTPELAPVDIVGTTCMENDCLYRGYAGQIQVGDYVVFDNVGAYTQVLRPPFISPAAPIIAYDQTATINIIRRRETPKDIFASYQFAQLSNL